MGLPKMRDPSIEGSPTVAVKDHNGVNFLITFIIQHIISLRKGLPDIIDAGFDLPRLALKQCDHAQCPQGRNV